MTLGEKIISLRNTHKMSQGDLAEKLEVSRQSVSKWETGASIPELDKLIMLSSLFHITLDELVQADLVPTEPATAVGEPRITYIVQEGRRNVKPIVGCILLGMGLLSGILGFLLSQALLVLGLCLILYGCIFLIIKRYTGLACGWLTTLLLTSVCYITGARAGAIGIGAGVTIVTLLLWLFWILLIVMIALTVRTVIKAVRRKRKAK